MKKSKVVAEKIHLNRIVVYKSSIDINVELIDEGINVHGFSFSFSHDIDFNFEDKLSRLRMDIKIQAKDENENELEAKGEFGIEYVYNIENLDEFLNQEEEGVQIDSNLGTTIIAIAYSTARGIVLQETQDTLMGGVILPVIDPIKLLEDN